MSDRRDLSLLTRGGEGAVIAMLLSIAIGSTPIATVVLVRCGLGWYAGPGIGALLFLLAVVIDLRSKRRAQRLLADFTFAHERFHSTWPESAGTAASFSESARQQTDAARFREALLTTHYPPVRPVLLGKELR